MDSNTKKVVNQITDIYQKYGYSRFKMNKFEEYDTYVNNKDFLKSDKMITFTDTNGKLLAMKPDVTISIIKNSESKENFVQKVYYNENVYRVSEGSYSFKEIMQSGLECIGDIDVYNLCETVLLAAKTLGCVLENYVLDISHLGLVSSVLADAGFDKVKTNAALTAISQKNLPVLKNLCENIEDKKAERVMALVNLCGSIKEVCRKLDIFCINTETSRAVNELKEICIVLDENNLSDKVRIDFSVVNDMSYYNGIVFKGYVEGVPTGVLSGGQYDGLVNKMERTFGGLGFALYLDLIERLFVENKDFDADVLLCYEKGTSPALISKKVRSIIESGKTVLVQKAVDDKIMCRETIFIFKDGEER